MKKKVGLLLVLLLILIFQNQVIASDTSTFKGKGTKESPYLVEDYDDLIKIQEGIEAGKDYKDVYFEQTENIKLNSANWIPIGTKKTSFAGHYDGAGYYIENLKLKANIPDHYVGLFGYLSGTVCNLGIQNSKINGGNCGAIAGTSVGNQASILNCYSIVKMDGNHVGGIASNFTNGVIAGCWSISNLNGAQVGGIVAESGNVKLYGCYSTTEGLAPGDIVSNTSYYVTKQEIFSKSFAKRLSIEAGLIQYLFANRYNIDVMQWKYENKALCLSSDNNYIQFFYYINYALPLLLFFFFIIIFFAKLYRRYKQNDTVWVKKSVRSLSFISLILILFLDTAIFAKGIKTLHPLILTAIVLLHILLVVLVILLYRIGGIKKIKITRNRIWFVAGLCLVCILEFIQFKNVPRYDACLYYGSLMQGASLFRLDLFTYIGAFVCWKWLQGLSLFLAPIEFLAPGCVISVYIGNMVITVITMICLYKLLRKMYPSLKACVLNILCIIFMLFPYAVGLFSYLSMDWQVSCFAIWLLYGIVQEDNLWISFCGYLLAFTKITGFVFYVITLCVIGLVQYIKNPNRNLFRKFKETFSFCKCFLWILPAILFLISFLWGEHFTIQNFYGTYVADSMIQIKSLDILGNTLVQAFVFGFRWIFALLMLASIFYRKKLSSSFVSGEGKLILPAITAATLATLFLLCIYASDAECPRYTTFMNTFFICIFPLFLGILKDNQQKILSMVLSLILFIQTFVTIDPSVFLFSSAKINTGKMNFYKLAISRDSRQGMNLGVDYGEGYESLGDLYCYNLQYSFYDDLLEKALTQIKPTKKDKFFVLDVIDYELQISGNSQRTYKIYWDTSKNKRTYKENSPYTIYLNEKSITSKELIKCKKKDLEKSFYLIVPDRIDASKALSSLEEKGYNLKCVTEPENIYGSLKVYQIKRY